jgi:hypothetical protein
MADLINYSLSSVPTIKRFLEDTKKYKLIMGPVGGGKSSGCVMHLFKTMINQKPDENNVRETKYAVIRNTTKQLGDTTKSTIDAWLPKSLYKWKESKYQYEFLFKLEDGTLVKSIWLLRALDNVDQVRDLLSLELTGAWINEAREIRYDVFKLLRTRIGRFPKGENKNEDLATYSYIILDTNPPDTESWLYKLFETKRQEDPEVAKLFSIFKQPSGLSPEAENLPNLPKNYYKDLMVGQDDDFVKVYVHGEYGYVKEGRPVFPNYTDSIHCAKEDLDVLPGLPLIIGMDFGLTPAAVITQQTPYGQFRILDELATMDTTSDIEEFVRERLTPLLSVPPYLGMEKIIIGDPAGSQRSSLNSATVFSTLRQLGYKKVYAAWTNSIIERIRGVNNYLTRTVQGNPAFIISPKCVILRKALMGKYFYKRLRVTIDKYSDLPDKGAYSHIADALQYAAIGYSPSFNEFSNRMDMVSVVNDDKGVSYDAWV